MAVVCPEVVEGFPGKGAGLDDGLFELAVDDFPCFSEGFFRVGEVAFVEGLELAAAPDAFHVEGCEGDGCHGERWKQSVSRGGRLELHGGGERLGLGDGMGAFFRWRMWVL